MGFAVLGLHGKLPHTRVDVRRSALSTFSASGAAVNVESSLRMRQCASNGNFMGAGTCDAAGKSYD